MSMDVANVCRLFRAPNDLLLRRFVPPLISGDGSALNQAHEHSDYREDERCEHERRWNSRSQLLRQLMRATLRKLQRR